MEKKGVYRIIAFVVFSAMLGLKGNGLFAEQKNIAPSSRLNTTQTLTPQATTPQRVPQDTRVTVQDNPRIVEFSVTPNALFLVGAPSSVIPTRNITLRWAVEPGPGGSRISSITVTKATGLGPVVNLRSANPNGEYSFEMPASLREGNAAYTLIATNQQGRTSTRTVELFIRPLNLFVGAVRFTPNVIPVGQICTIDIPIANNSIPLSGVNIYVSGTRADSSRTRNPYVRILNTTLNRGPNNIPATFRHGIYAGEEALILEMEYNNNIIGSARIELERRNIEAYSPR